MVILIQGAMDVEVDMLIEHYAPCESTTIAGFDFYIAERKHKIVISKTGVGLINAAIATTLAIERFKPDLVINQGCAGAHVADLAIGDIVIGEKCAYINNFYTNTKCKGGGSDSLQWYPCPKRSYEIPSTKRYVDIAARLDCSANKRVGVLGSGDIFSKEYDRIEYIRSLFGELCEDMESIAAYKACEQFGVERIAMRVISNNELNGSEFEYGVCRDMQNFVISFIREITSARV